MSTHPPTLSPTRPSGHSPLYRKVNERLAAIRLERQRLEVQLDAVLRIERELRETLADSETKE